MFRNKDDFQKLCKILRYEFKNKNLLLQALTRRSALVEGRQSHEIDDFQRLEFIGDKVLNLIISDTLITLHPSWREGRLTQEAAKYVNNKGPLAAIARQLHLNDFLIMGRGEELNNQARENDKVLSDAIEALLGAIWIDSNRNYDLLKNFIIEHWGPLGLLPTSQYQELIEIILDYKTPQPELIKRFREAFNRVVDSTALHNIIEHTIDDPELLEIVLTKPIKKTLLTEMLIECVQSGWATQVAMLLKKGAKATAMCKKETLLQYAVTSHFEESPQIVELLLQHNADPNWKRGKVKEKYFNGEFTLLAYLRKTAVETIEYEDANTTLHWVMLDDDVHDSKQQLQITQILLKYGANPNLRNEDWKIPLHIICENFYQTEASADIIRELVAAKSDVNSQDAQGNTPLHSLLIGDFNFINNDPKILDAVKYLLTTNFNINAQNKAGNTVLHLIYLLAAKYRSSPYVVFAALEITDMILTKNPNKQLKNTKGLTAEYLERTISIDEKILAQIGFLDPIKDIIKEKSADDKKPSTFTP